MAALHALAVDQEAINLLSLMPTMPLPLPPALPPKSTQTQASFSASQSSPSEDDVDDDEMLEQETGHVWPAPFLLLLPSVTPVDFIYFYLFIYS